MKVKLKPMQEKIQTNKKDVFLNENQVFDVIGLTINKETSVCEIEIIYDKYSYWSFPINIFEIVDASIPTDWTIVENLSIYQILPEVINYPGFWEDFIDNYSQARKLFYNRFIGQIFPEQNYQFSDYFQEYQNPSITITAEAIGDNWVICPECNQAFDTDPNIGELVCPNIACKTKLNNPYAKKFPVE